ncbi:hypothetical protein [Thermomonospora umbrina]|uniref:Uncharacterized protein n=1 Tax=Thermomonospora umbrina TaxID=111806 RepID=A0A3D9SYN1_9ACTN|nr:hypothetical protein [Thermomonospora umbrina]REE99143.1 hypothetical protein DFJ69_4650 [Thermomonospora umbrina]
MTVVLVVMCLIVGGLELYLGKQSRDQARAFADRIEELREQVGKQNGVLVTVGEQLTAELSRVKREVLPGLDDRLRRNTGQIEELGGLLRQADEYIKTQASRLQDLEQQRVTLSALRRKLTDLETAVRAAPAPDTPDAGERIDTALVRLADLERNDTEIQKLQRDLTRTLEDVEDVVGDLLRYTGGELDDALRSSLRGGRSEGASPVPGRLWARDPQVQDVMEDMYERCLGAVRLSTRFRTVERAEGGGPERRRYFLSGRSMEDLAGAFTELLISTGGDLGAAALLPTDVRVAGAPHPADRPVMSDEAALKGLMRALYDSGGGTAQIGPLLTVRTREELLCAVLTSSQSLELENDEVFWDPSAAALRLRRMASHQVWELTDWAGRLPTT